MRLPPWTAIALIGVVLATGAVPQARATGSATTCQVRVSGLIRVLATDEEVAAAVGRPLTLDHAELNTVPAPTQVASGPGSDAPGSAATCGWHGTPLASPSVFSQYDVQLDVAVVPYSTVQLARQAFAAERANAQGSAQGVSGVGDQAFLSVPGDVSAQFDVQTGPYVLSVSTNSGTREVFASHPWVGVAKVIVGNLAPAPGPGLGVCTPDAQPGPDANDGAALARDQVNTPGADAATDDRRRDALSQLQSHAADPAFLVGFFNTVTPDRAVDWLGIDVNDQPLDPLMPDAISDWFFKVFETALSTCEVSHAFVVAFLADLRFTTPVLRYVSQDRDASRGLLIHLSGEELLTTFADSSFPKPQYTLLYGSALAAGDEITALLPATVASLPGSAPSHFTRDQGAALSYVAAFTRDGADLMSAAIARYAAARVPPAPAPARPYGSLVVTTAYNAWATLIGQLQYAVASPTTWLLTAIYSPESIPSESAWEDHVANGGDPAGFTEGKLIDALNGYAGSPALPVVQFLTGKLVGAMRSDSPSDAEAKAAAANWLCGQETTLEEDLFLVLLSRHRFLYGYQGGPPQPVGEEVMIAGQTYQLTHVGSPPTTYERGRIDSIIRPYLSGLGTYLADSHMRSTGVAVRVPFDVIAYLWQQQMARDNITECTLPSIAGAPVPPWVVEPTSGISSAIMVTGTGFAPGSTVIVSGHSAPVTLGAAQADPHGSFLFFLNRSDLLGLGTHEIIASGRTPSGSPRQIQWSVQITAAPKIQQLRGSGHSRSLSQWRLWLSAAAILVLVLVVGIVLGMRRRRTRSATSVS